MDYQAQVPAWVVMPLRWDSRMVQHCSNSNKHEKPTEEAVAAGAGERDK